MESRPSSGTDKSSRRTGRVARRAAPVLTPSTDYLPPCLMTLLATATRAMNEHTDDNGLCAICGDAWPCQRVQLADVALAAL